jgi:hypothetical protein
VRRLLVAAFVLPSSPILVTLMEEALGSFETSVLTRATRRNIPEDTILHSHRRENLKPYNLNVVLNVFLTKILTNLYKDIQYFKCFNSSTASVDETLSCLATGGENLHWQLSFALPNNKAISSTTSTTDSPKVGFEYRDLTEFP